MYLSARFSLISIYLSARYSPIPVSVCLIFPYSCVCLPDISLFLCVCLPDISLFLCICLRDIPLFPCVCLPIFPTLQMIGAEVHSDPGSTPFHPPTISTAVKFLSSKLFSLLPVELRKSGHLACKLVCANVQRSCTWLGYRRERLYRSALLGYCTLGLRL